MDGERVGRRPLHRQGRIVGRQGMRRLPTGGAPRPTGGNPAYPDRVPAGTAPVPITLILSIASLHCGGVTDYLSDMTDTLAAARTIEAPDLGRLAPSWLEAIECMRVLPNTGDNIVGELLRDTGTFYEWNYYPDGDVYDPASHAQYCYHAHPQELRSGKQGHFHTFMRGTRHACRNATRDGGRSGAARCA
jgi:hypothetical protein